MATRAWFVARALLAVFVASPGPGTASAEDPPSPAPAPPPVAAATPDDPDPTDTLRWRIGVTLDRGIAWLRERGGSDGWYGDVYRREDRTYEGGQNGYVMPYGATALAAYTLLKCHVPADDPAVLRALAWLRTHDRNGGSSYELAMKLLAVTATADPFKKYKDATAAGDRVRLVGEERKWAEELAAALVAQRAETGGWRYWGRAASSKPGPSDLSSTHLAALALSSAERCGIQVDPSVWTDAIRFARAQQEASGPESPRAVERWGREAGLTTDRASGAKDVARGFAYRLGTGPERAARASGAMTACGIGTLQMARLSLRARHPEVWAKVDAAAVQTSLHDGLAWLDVHWDPFVNPPGGGMNLYYAWCVERAMDLVGAQRLGARYWYMEMAEQVLARQQQDGMWTGGVSPRGASDVLDTCFALLFLHRPPPFCGPCWPDPNVTTGGDGPPEDGR